jgi:hypothetical protein
MREEIKKAVPVSGKTAESPKQEPTDSILPAKAREMIQEAATIPNESPKRETVTKKRNRVAVRINKSSISIEAKKRTEGTVIIMAEGQIHRPMTTSRSRLKVLRDQSVSRQT